MFHVRFATIRGRVRLERCGMVVFPGGRVYSLLYLRGRQPKLYVQVLRQLLETFQQDGLRQ